MTKVNRGRRGKRNRKKSCCSICFYVCLCGEGERGGGGEKKRSMGKGKKERRELFSGVIISVFPSRIKIRSKPYT